jgi:hypothetical protein
MLQKITSKQMKAIYMLASGATVREVASQLKMHRETLSRWQRQPVFTHKLEQVMREAEEGMKTRLISLMDTSISALTKGITSTYSDPKHIQMALNVLKLLGNARELDPNDPKQTQTDAD